jgi:DNA uptake protein ComE-like DNA-binding protein
MRRPRRTPPRGRGRPPPKNPPPPPPAAAPAKADAKTAAKPEAKKGLLDINSASADELRVLPGVGDAYSKKIIDNRPYAKKDQLVSRKVLPEKTYQGIKDLIIAKQK